MKVDIETSIQLTNDSKSHVSNFTKVEGNNPKVIVERNVLIKSTIIDHKKN